MKRITYLIPGLVAGLVLGLIGTGTAVANGLLTSADIADGTIEPHDLSPATRAMIDGTTATGWTTSDDVLALSPTAVALTDTAAVVNPGLSYKIKAGDRVSFSYTGETVPSVLVGVGSWFATFGTEPGAGDDTLRTKTLTVPRSGVLRYVSISRTGSFGTTVITNLTINGSPVKFR